MKPTARGRIGRILLKALVVLVSQIAVHAGPGKGAGNAAFPEINLPEVARGGKAAQVLGARLPDVAKAYGLRADELQSLLREDATLAIDVKGRLHYIDPAPEAGAVVEDTEPAAAAIPLADTFKLHSRPGAKRMLYLDFDGHVISGTGWNASYNGGRDIVAPAWDVDGSPSTFGDTERTRIQQIWKRVAEDYAPFDIDVTTELLSESQLTRSSTSDEYYGTRVLVSAISQYFGNYGGIAYIGAFDDVGDSYKPALVFPENLGPNGEKYIAEACSHEAGHNLGLNHDGTTTGQAYYGGQGSGTTSWAPIMGNSYNRNVTQWSKGEYASANNKQDDFVVMQSYGLPYRPDDHGNTASGASYFAAGSLLDADGIIERQTDVDVFAFTTGAGQVNINVLPHDLGANLDIAAEIRDASGVLLAASNPADQLYATFSLSLTAGTYFLHVRGAGFGDPVTTGYSSYGSVGNYAVSGTVVNSSGAVAPVANFTALQTTGTLDVQCNGAGSFDQDGSIVSYAWAFGDGASGSGATASHTYAVAGTYNVTLTVTDNSGLSSSKTTAVTVVAPPAPAATIRVGSIALALDRKNSGTAVRATVKVVDAAGVAVPGVTVNGSFNSVIAGTVTATTDASGNAVLVSRRSKKSGTVTFAVSELSKSGYVWNNVQSSATITLP